MKSRLSFCAAIVIAALCHGICWAEPATDDAIGTFLQSRDISTSGQAIGLMHNASPEFRRELAEDPNLDLFGPLQRRRFPRHENYHNRHDFNAQALLRSNVVLTAMGYLGRPYVWGGSSMQSGFDCSGFVLSLFERATGHVLPRTAAEQARATEHISRKELKPGDLVFFNTLHRRFSHVGLYIGNGRFIHAPRTGADIRVENMNIPYWRDRFDGARRVVTRRLAEQVASAS